MTPIAFYPKNLDKFISPVMSPGVMSRPLPHCLPSRHFPCPKEAGKTTRPPLRARRACHFQVVGGMMLRSDDDLEVTWEVDQPKSARDVDIATGGKPGTTESIRTPFRGGRSPSSPSTVVSRGGSFGGGESVPPDSSNSSSSSSSSRSSSSNNNSSTDVDGGARATSERAVGSDYAELHAELPKGEANRLKSWARHG